MQVSSDWGSWLLDRISFYVADYENIFEEINKYVNPNAITFKTLAKLIVVISDYSCIESYLLSPAIKYIHKTFKGKFTEFKLLESIIIEIYTNPDINKYTRKNIVNNLYNNSNKGIFNREFDILNEYEPTKKDNEFNKLEVINKQIQELYEEYTSIEKTEKTTIRRDKVLIQIRMLEDMKSKYCID